MSNPWLLSGIVVLALGFLLRLNPLLVVAAAAAATWAAAGLPVVDLISAFGKAFNENRFVTIIYIMLPMIGLLERYGLQERARTLIAKMRRATTGRLLIGYMLVRQLTAALGLTSVAGPAQTVRPLVAPMAEAAAERDHGALDLDTRERVRGYVAATDTVGLFFGEDIFLAVASILLIKGFLEQNGISLQPFDLSVWAIPTAVCAFLIHAARLLWLDSSFNAKTVRIERDREAER